MTDLFRKEVIQKQGQNLYGDVVLSSPLSHIAIAALLTVIMSGLVIFAIFGNYARKERVAGYLTPDQGLIRILPQQPGLIDRKYVEIGDEVTKGEPLFSIRTDTNSGQGTAVAGQLLQLLQSEKEDLLERKTLVPQQYAVTRARLKGQIEAARSEAERLGPRIELQQRTVDNERVVLEKFQSLLNEEAASALEVSTQENRLLQARQSLEVLQNERKRLVFQAADLETELKLLPISERQDISEITNRISALDQRMTQTEGQESYIISAPISGRVASLVAREGQMANGQTALATLLPKDGKLEAQLFVPSRAAGFVEEGQEVRLLYDAFPYQKFGFHRGRISNVSRSVISSTDLPMAPQSPEPVFIVTIELDRQTVDAEGQLYSLQSGMTLSADIILEDRKIWEWVFEPVLGAARN